MLPAVNGYRGTAPRQSPSRPRLIGTARRLPDGSLSRLGGTGPEQGRRGDGEVTVHERRALPIAPGRPKLLDQVRDAIRTRHYSYRTEEAYVGWIKRFILFHRKHHPAEMGKAEIEAFLTALAVDRRVAASTQNQALAALLFLGQRRAGA